MKANEVEQRDFLLTCAVWQDTLLHSYRSQHITIQGFLVAGGAAVLAVQLTGLTQELSAHPLKIAVLNSLFSLLLLFLFLLQLKTTTELKHVVANRAHDLDHWHKLVVISENAFSPEQRAFTNFKKHQQVRRGIEVEQVLSQSNPTDDITEQDAKKLIEKGILHTRKVVDENYFGRLQLLWISIVTISFSISGWLLYLWVLSNKIPNS